MIAAICILTGTFLYDINRRIKTQCRMIVRIEKIFGLYEEHYFTNQIPEKDRKCIPPTVFPNEASDWGEKQNRLFLYPHILGVIFSAIAAISSLFITLPNPNPQTQAKASERSIVTPGSTQSEKYFDIKPHFGR